MHSLITAISPRGFPCQCALDPSLKTWPGLQDDVVFNADPIKFRFGVPKVAKPFDVLCARGGRMPPIARSFRHEIIGDKVHNMDEHAKMAEGMTRQFFCRPWIGQVFGCVSVFSVRSVHLL